MPNNTDVSDSRPPLSKILTLKQLADLWGFEGRDRTRRARRWIQRLGIGRQTPSGRWYTTVRDVSRLADDSLQIELLLRN